MNSQTVAVGLDRAPELADHGFQGLVVLPGAWYLRAALDLPPGAAPGTRWRLARAAFRRPLILAEGAAALEIAADARPAGGLHISFREAGGDGAPLAELEREPDAGALPGAPASLAAFCAGATLLGETESLYARLEAAGNRYGPRFQGLERVWRQGSHAAGRLRPRPAADAVKPAFDPLLADAAVQLLAVLAWDRKKTFVLQGIASVRWSGDAPRGPLWALATVDGERGDVSVHDETGATVLALEGVTFAFLESASAPAASPGLPLVVAATFTAEPVEDALRFWAEEAQLPLAPQFAAYGQVFQELLDPRSPSRRNASGANLFLLNLADWVPPSCKCAPLPPPASVPWPGDLARHVLPNGTEVAHLNRHETEYVFQEIFGDRCYLRHGIRLPERPVVIDIGANIGLFSLFVRTERPEASVYAYEPSPVAFRALAANCAAYGPRLHAFNAGVSERRGQAALTFYDRSSVFSSFHPDQAEDRGAIRAVVENMVRSELGGEAGPVDDYVTDLMADRLDARTFSCELVSVSDILRDQGLRRVDLLKIDAEKCELEILRGIEDGDWSRIEQVVIEVHDRTRAAVAEVQSLLTARGFHCACEEESLLAGSGLFNVYAVRREPSREAATPADRRWTELQAKAGEFERAAAAYAGAGGPPAVVLLCPPPAHGLSVQDRRQLEAIEDRIADQIASLPGFSCVSSRTLTRRHPGAPWHYAAVDTVGHVPYTPEGFALLAGDAVRALAATRRPPFKVIALDCDHTLWRGACGEEGPLGVTVTAAHREVQEFMLRQMRAGMILCLCSKNAESDVWAVFERHPDMVLRREHFAAARINWRPKSENLRALARELNVGEDSLILVDDNPLEAAEVRAALSPALALVLPADFAQAPRFLENCWVFDTGPVTAEDRARTRMLREGTERERYRERAATLAEFIAGLDLRVEVTPAEASDLARLAQLTQRTNQFNFTTIRRSESELRHFLEHGGEALAVAVRDRFGDYGGVGAVLSRGEGDVCRIDTFLLSCRVLGRGVEHQVLAEAARRAASAGRTWIDLPYAATAKNRPALDFAEGLPAEARPQPGGGCVYRLPVSRAAALRYQPAASPPPPPVTTAGGLAPPAPETTRCDWQRLAEEGADPGRLLAAVEAHRARAAGEAGGGESLPDTVEGRLLGVWRRVLLRPRVGRDDNFFDVGGTSLKAVQAVAAIRRELRLPVSVTQLFECPTVRLLAAKLAPAPAAPAAGPAPDDALERGARRKARLRRPAA